ncbi:MAG: glycerophosphoryl diester phosphodiesterase membrane domain-containing protein [Bacteroidales bacterium]|nr:glycerophosphoryl diester phosphodiesterase membrane domain-containing protein [Bacteroidales bacterium]
MFKGFTNYMNVVLAGLLSGALIGIGIFLFIVPGIILACRFAFVPYLVMDKNLDPVKAVEDSWRLTKGYGWRIFGLGLLSILIYIAGLMVMFVGVLISMMWVHAAFAAMYQGVLEERGEYREMAENSNNHE